MNLSPAVAVVIPVFDGARFLAEAINSVLAQTLPPQEVIVVDDGSSDESAALALGYGAPVAVLRHSDNRGGGAARNTGIEAATAELVALLDADDRMRPDRLAREVAHLGAHPYVAGVMSRMVMFCEPGQHLPPWTRDPRTGQPVAHAAASITVRRSVFDRVGLFDSAYRVADVEWLVRARDRGERVDLLDACGTERRIHDANMSHDVHRDPGVTRDYFRMLRARRAAR